MTRYVKRPVQVEAWRWDGGDTAQLDLVLGLNWGRADAHEVGWDHADDDEIVVWNSLERTWVPLPVGHWLIRGVLGEFYPCDNDAFHLTYKWVSA